VLCSTDGILSKYVRSSHHGRGRCILAAARPHQHDAGRLAEPFAESDAASVLLQFIAIVITMVVVWAMGR
jgi:hypothetical protein